MAFNKVLTQIMNFYEVFISTSLSSGIYMTQRKVQHGNGAKKL